MQSTLKGALVVSTLLMSAHAVAQVSFYEGEGFRGLVRAVSRDP